MFRLLFFFFFQAEDGIRDKLVTGVQTCALPICAGLARRPLRQRPRLGRRDLRARLARRALARRLAALLPQLRPLALQRGVLAFQRAQRLGAPLQILLQLADRGALHEQPLAHLLLQRRPPSELGLHRGEIALGGRALSIRGRVLPLPPPPPPPPPGGRPSAPCARRWPALCSRSAASARSPSSRFTSSLASARRRSTSVRRASAVCRPCTRASRSRAASARRSRAAGTALASAADLTPSAPSARSRSSSSRRTSVIAIPNRSSIIFE